MKTKILIFTLLSIFSIDYGQKAYFESNMQVNYQVDFKPDPEVDKIDTKVATLYLNNKLSIFQDSRRSKLDSLIFAEKLTMLPKTPIFSINHIIRKDYTNQTITYTEIVDNINLGYKEDINSLKWVLKEGKKSILNLPCNEAAINFHGRTYTAWYTKEIPISDGPYKFSGLPGLIMEISDSDNNFHYTAISIIKKPAKLVYDSSYKSIERLKLRDAKINNVIKNSTKTVRLNPLEKE